MATVPTITIAATRPTGQRQRGPGSVPVGNVRATAGKMRIRAIGNNSAATRPNHALIGWPDWLDFEECAKA